MTLAKLMSAKSNIKEAIEASIIALGSAGMPSTTEVRARKLNELTMALSWILNELRRYKDRD